MRGFVAFTAYGEAKGAGSKKGFVNPKNGRVIITDDSGKAGKNWRNAVADAARENYQGELLRGPLKVTMTFYRPRPKGHYRSGKHSDLLRPAAPKHPTTRPDVLTPARAIEYSLTGVLWHDDSQIVSEHLRKHYGEPARVVVTVQEEL